MNREAENCTGKPEPVSFFHIKAIAENIFKKLGINIDKLTINEIVTESIPEGLVYSSGNKILLETGYISDVLMKKFEIDSPVCFADFHLGAIMKIQIKNEVLFNGLPKFPIVRRDLALLIDKEIKFKQIKELAFRTERNILQEVGLFDVYEGKGIAPGKKSYAVSFLLRDDKRTLNDKQIDKTMKKIFTAFERELGAQLR